MFTNFLMPPLVTYPEPGWTTVTDTMPADWRMAVATAPLPVGSLMVTVGGRLNLVPGFVTTIEVRAMVDLSVAGAGHGPFGHVLMGSITVPLRTTTLGAFV